MRNVTRYMRLESALFRMKICCSPDMLRGQRNEHFAQGPSPCGASFYYGHSKMRLLVIEDYPPLQQSLVKGLREAGFAVDATRDGADGLWYAMGSEYDV